MANGKGSKPRPTTTTKKEFNKNFDRIFKKKKKPAPKSG